MRAHHDARTGFDAGAERHELHRIESRIRGADRRQSDVRVDIGVAVSREVLQGGEHPVLLQTVHVRAHETRDRVRVFAEGADIDDRFERFVVNVRVGPYVDVDAYI